MIIIKSLRVDVTFLKLYDQSTTILASVVFNLSSAWCKGWVVDHSSLTQV